MNLLALRELLERVRDGDLPIDAALEQLKTLPYRDLGVATVDHHRALRQGCPEVIYGAGKSAQQIDTIAREIAAAGQTVLITRLDADKAGTLARDWSGFRYVEPARVAVIERAPAAARSCGPVAVITAGTSDIGVAEEAVVTLTTLGFEARRLFDVGVAGIHRLLGRADELQGASAAIVIAGMEGALPSVVGGLLSCPLVAVPTSGGYGTALAGFTALFAMLTSCAAGITVVNIDNGFGAAMAVHRMFPPTS